MPELIEPCKSNATNAYKSFPSRLSFILNFSKTQKKKHLF